MTLLAESNAVGAGMEPEFCERMDVLEHPRYRKGSDEWTLLPLWHGRGILQTVIAGRTSAIEHRVHWTMHSRYGSQIVPEIIQKSRGSRGVQRS